MKICIVVGTRPEIIKMCPIIRECERLKLDYFIIHSGQHYSYELDAVFFEELNLPKPKYKLQIGSAPHGNQTGNIMIKLEPILLNEKPNIILVQGDTNTVLASALTAVKLGIKIGHVEAGLRSYDKRMPEETNRVVTDHISDYLFAPTNTQEKILLSEGIPKEKIFVVGNTIVDALLENIKISKKGILSKIGLTKKKYFLVTAHRSLNVDIKENLEKLLLLLKSVADEFDYQLIWPIHPRTKKMVDKFGLKIPKSIKVIDPVGYLEFLDLEKNARLILTDSGGIQEEACILKVPCITLRENTERPETVDVGANSIVALDSSLAIKEIKRFLSSDCNWANPFGDGTSAKKIISTITKK